MARTKQTARKNTPPGEPPRKSVMALAQRREKEKKEKAAAAQGRSSPYASPQAGHLPSSGIVVATTTTTPSHVHRYTPDALRKKYRDCYTDAADAPMHPGCPFLYPDFLETRVADGDEGGGSFGRRTYTKTTEGKDAPASADDIRRIIKHVISRLPSGRGAAAAVTPEKVRKRLYDELYEFKFGRKFVARHGAPEDAYRLYDPPVAANIKKLMKKTSPVDETDRATVDCVGLLINAAIDVWNRSDASWRPPGFKQTKKGKTTIPFFGLCNVGSSNADIAFDRQKDMLEVFFKLYTPSACVDAFRALTYIEYQEEGGAADGKDYAAVSVINQIMDRYGVPLHPRQGQQQQKKKHPTQLFMQQQSQRKQSQPQSQSQQQQQQQRQRQQQQQQQQRQQPRPPPPVIHFNLLPVLYVMLRALEGEYSSTGTRYDWDAICRALQNARVGGTQQAHSQDDKVDADDDLVFTADNDSSDDIDFGLDILEQQQQQQQQRGTAGGVRQVRGSSSQAQRFDKDESDSSDSSDGFVQRSPKRRRGTAGASQARRFVEDESDSSDGFVQRPPVRRRGTGFRRPKVDAQAQQSQSSQDQMTAFWNRELKKRPIVYGK